MGTSPEGDGEAAVERALRAAGPSVRSPAPLPTGADAALADLLGRLRALGYAFVAVTPATHARVLARPVSSPPDLRDIFGWNRPFAEADLDPELLGLLESAGALSRTAAGLRSMFRVATLGGDIFLHSSFPTHRPDAVFFGPDTYRFVRFVRERLPRVASADWIVDMGAGSGAGGIAVARSVPQARITLVDVNSEALRLARINAAVAGVPVETIESDRVPKCADLVIANPPYMIDPGFRAYCDGGGLLGGEVALEWVRQSLATLAPGGAMLLYGGAAVTAGRAPLSDALAQLCSSRGCSLTLEEIDPDVFGEELEEPAYQQVERIAAIGVLVLTHRR